MVRPAKWLSIILSLHFLVAGYHGYAQLVLLDSAKTNDDIVTFSIDRSGNLFLGLRGGTLQKYDLNLDSLQSYNPTRVGDFTLIEAWHGFQIFAFNRKFQDFVLLDRFLARDTRYSLGESGVFFVDLATIGSDQNLWLLEENGLRLLKYNFRSGELVLNVVIDPWLDNQNHEFSFLREYQNLLFLVDENSGTYVFDNLGNFIKQLDTGNANFIAFHGEFIYYLTPNELIEQNLYKESRITHELPLATYQGVLFFNDHFYLIGKRKVERFLIR